MSQIDLECTIDFEGVSKTIAIKGAAIPVLFDDTTPSAVVDAAHEWLNAKIAIAIETTVKPLLITQWLVDNVKTTP